MQRTTFTKAITLALAFVAGQALHGQSAYFQAVTNLNPAGYWPLSETVQPPQPFANSLVASNIGSVGAAGDGYYGAWYQPSGNTWYLTNHVVQTNGITFASDGDQALWCNNSAGQYVVVPRTTNGVYNPAVTIVPPFSIEAWVVPTYTGGRAGIIASEGEANLNYGGPNTNNPYYGGLGGPGWAGFVLGQYQNYFFFNYYMTNGESKANEVDSLHPTGGTSTLMTNTWNHIVCTFDGTTLAMWVNGVEVKTVTHSKNGAGLTWAPDLTTPLMIGSGGDITANGGGGLAAYTGVIDEVALYSQILPQSSIENHYMAGYGTNSSGASVSYTNVVQGDDPTFYFRLDESEPVTDGGYASASYPIANNYGTLGEAANGVYQPGTTPGVPGPSYIGFGGSNAVSLNGFLGAVDVGGGSLPVALNPSGMTPVTVVSWFQGNPADSPARYQDILGHGSSSYRLALDGSVGAPRFNPGASIGPEMQFVNATDMVTNRAAINDGQWHMLAGVSDGTNAYMYLDGNLVKSTNSVTGINIVGSTVDLLLGGDPQFTYADPNNGDTDRTFDGQIAQAAMWTSALSAAQIQSLYNIAGVPPSITTQPVGATNNQGATVAITALVAGSQPISFQWYKTNNEAVAGQTNATLSYVSITTNAIGSYYLVATSPYGSVTSSVVQIFVYGAPTLDSDSQTNIDVYAGSDPTLFVDVSGGVPLTYQWLSNDVLVASGANNTYTITNAQNGATYTCNVTNSAGSLLAGPFILTILPDPTAPYPVAIVAAHPMGFWRLDESSGLTAFDLVGGNNGIYTNTALDFQAPYDSTSDPDEGDAPGFGIDASTNSYVGWISTNINFATPTNVNAEFSIECWLNEALVFSDAGIVSLGYGNGGEEFALDCGGNDPSHDLRFYVREANGTSVGAASGVSPFYSGGWHHVVGVCDEAGGHVYLYIDGTNAGVGTIPSKSGILTSTESMAIGSRQASAGPNYTNQFIGSIDEVAVYNYALTPAQAQAHYFASGVAPVITQMIPASETTNVGDTATFSVAVTGTPVLYYQWFDPNNNLISTNATLEIPDVTASTPNGQYSVVVSNAYGVVTGYTSLQVNLGPPELVQDISPLTQTLSLYSGLSTVSYTIVVSGSAPFAYQWYQDGAPVSSATNATYTFNAIAGTNTYYVTVTNSETASAADGVPLSSSVATVIGVPAPQLTPTNYAYRVEISFPGYTGQPLTNFPALITLNPSTVGGLAYGEFATNGSDLRFTDAGGKNILAAEIDQWNDGGTSTVWVDIPLLNGSNIWAYWGNPDDTDVAPASTNVWLNAGYQIVYHLKESGFPYADSTGQYPATNGVAPTPTPGVVGLGQSFDNAAYITPGVVTLSNQFTTYAWVFCPTSDYSEQSIWVNQEGGYGNNGFSEFLNSYQTSDNTIHADCGNNAGAGADYEGDAVTFGEWHLVAYTWDQPNSVTHMYVDGTFYGSGTGTAVNLFAITNQLNLGAFLNPALFITGDLDEARVQYGIASTNWLITTYLNMADTSFISYSSVNLQPVLTITSSVNGYLFSWPANDGVFTLETATSLAGPWTAVTTPAPVMTDGVWEQTVQPAAGNHFYRLEEQ